MNQLMFQLHHKNTTKHWVVQNGEVSNNFDCKPYECPINNILLPFYEYSNDPKIPFFKVDSKCVRVCINEHSANIIIYQKCFFFSSRHLTNIQRNL